MNKVSSFAAILFVTLAAAGCTHAPLRPGVDVVSKADLAAAEAVKKQLYVQYREWKGTPYTMGGLSKNGIDCSGFVYRTYRERLGIVIPRTTELQAQAGKEIKRGMLRAGDLVFFKTAVKVRHVGIYMENGKFLHASTKKGVMISKLNDYYWQDVYWQARRVYP